MKFIKIYGIALLFKIIAVSCTETVPADLPNDAVVEAILFEGKAINHIKLSRVSAYQKEQGLQLPEPATPDIVITSAGKSYSFVQTDNSGDFVAKEKTDIVKEGEVYHLNCLINGNILQSVTSIPSKPSGYSISQSTVAVPEIVVGTPPPSAVNPIRVSWINHDQGNYYLSIQSEEPEKGYINYLAKQEADKNKRDLTIINLTPTSEDSYQIDPLKDLAFFGKHRMVIFHINQEYKNLLELALTNGSQILIPESNIENGLGIFTGIATDTVYLNVIKSKN